MAHCNQKQGKRRNWATSLLKKEEVYCSCSVKPHFNLGCFCFGNDDLWNHWCWWNWTLFKFQQSILSHLSFCNIHFFYSRLLLCVLEIEKFTTGQTNKQGCFTWIGIKQLTIIKRRKYKHSRSRQGLYYNLSIYDMLYGLFYFEAFHYRFHWCRTFRWYNGHIHDDLISLDATRHYKINLAFGWGSRRWGIL